MILYGHYDVQSAEPLDEWTSPPYAPEVRDGRLYARGATDDKGQILPLIWAARELAAAGELPVNVRFLIDGEEEIGGPSAEHWLRADDGPADAAIAFDSRMPDPQTPILVTSARGTMHLRIEVRSADNDLHSGAGNTVLNAAHVLHRMLGAVLPDEHGRLPEALRAGRAEPSDIERAGWSRLPGGATDIERLGGAPARSRRRRTTATVGSATSRRSTCTASRWATPTRCARRFPATARAMLSMRLAPGQTSARLWPVLERTLRAAVPAGADVQITLNNACDPARVDPLHPVTQVALQALERAAGVAPVMVPAGGSLPVLTGFAARGIPAVLTGFGTLDSRVHASDESIHLECLSLAFRSGLELLRGLGTYNASANPVSQEVMKA